MEDKIIMKGCCFMEIKQVTCIQDEKGNSFHVGDQCEITNLNDEVIKGLLISINPKTNLVMINPPTKYIEILNINEIKDIKLCKE